MKLRKIKVYGLLRKYCGQSCFEAAIKTPKDVFLFLKANFPDLENHMSNQMYKIRVNGETLDNIDLNINGDIEVIPLVVGAGSTFKKIAMVVVGVAIYYYSGGLAGTFGIQQGATFAEKFVFLAKTLQTVGAVMAVSGISSLLGLGQEYGNPQDLDIADPNLRASYSFSNINNVATAGTPIPIIYGEILAGSIIISSGVDSLQVRKDIGGSTPFRSLIQQEVSE
tara:strand:- start:5848 stop:6519 length:672 start_codon:yes stop_codon:yes gene_type:complete